MPCRHYVVSGRVQGVFYRASTREQANRLGIVGWVRNCEDGSVELVACGSNELLSTLEQWLWQGPQLARVSEVQVKDVAPDHEYVEFGIRH